MPKTVNAIPSRQRADLLIESTTNLGIGATFSSDTRQVDGYGGLNVYGFSNESFLVRIQEALSASGPFNETDRETSALNEAGTFQQVCRRFVPCGSFVRVFVDNLGAGTTTTFQFQLLGLPIGDSSVAIIAGGGGFVPAVRDADADSDFAASLLGWVVNSRMAVLGAADYERMTGRPFDDGSIDETLFGQNVRAAMTGRDSSAGVGSRNVPVEARNADAAADVADTLVGLLTNSRSALFDNAFLAWRLQEGTQFDSISGTLPAAVASAAWTASLTLGVDNSGVGVIEPVEARNFDANADVLASLVGLLVNSRPAIRIQSSGTWVPWQGQDPASVSGVSSGSANAAYTNAVIAGVDNTGAEVLRPVEARDFSASGDVFASLIGLLVNSRNSIFRASAATWDRLFGDTPSVVSGTSSGAVIAAYVNAVTAGVDNTGAEVLRPVEARNITTAAGVDELLVGLLTNARMAVHDLRTADYHLAAAREDVVGGSASFLGTVVARQSGYSTSLSGRRFIVTVPAAVSVTGTTSFAAVSPQILLQAAGTNDLILRSITITLVTAAGADPVRIHGIIDPDSRFSSGGTSRTPSNANTSDATASTAAQVRDGAIVATAADADERDVFDTVLSNAVGSSTSVDFQDGVIIGVSDTFLVYVQGGTSAPTFTYTYEFEDVNIQ